MWDCSVHMVTSYQQQCRSHAHTQLLSGVRLAPAHGLHSSAQAPQGGQVLWGQLWCPDVGETWAVRPSTSVPPGTSFPSCYWAAELSIRLIVWTGWVGRGASISRLLFSYVTWPTFPTTYSAAVTFPVSDACHFPGGTKSTQSLRLRASAFCGVLPTPCPASLLSPRRSPQPSRKSHRPGKVDGTMALTLNS